MLDIEDDETNSDDVTSMEASELKSEIARVCDTSGYSEVPLSSTNDASMFLANNPIPVRERGHSLCVESTPGGLLELGLEPRSKSLRLKRRNKETSK